MFKFHKSQGKRDVLECVTDGKCLDFRKEEEMGVVNAINISEWEVCEGGWRGELAREG